MFTLHNFASCSIFKKQSKPQIESRELDSRFIEYQLRVKVSNLRRTHPWGRSLALILSERRFLQVLQLRVGAPPSHIPPFQNTSLPSASMRALHFCRSRRLGYCILNLRRSVFLHQFLDNVILYFWLHQRIFSHNFQAQKQVKLFPRMYLEHKIQHEFGVGAFHKTK